MLYIVIPCDCLIGYNSALLKSEPLLGQKKDYCCPLVLTGIVTVIVVLIILLVLHCCYNMVILVWGVHITVYVQLVQLHMGPVGKETHCHPNRRLVANDT